MRLRLALLIALALASVARAEDTIWTAVVLATNAAAPKTAPDELAKFVPKLKRAFGYNQFEVVGSASEKIDHGTEAHLAPTQSFAIDVKARRSTTKEARGGYLLNIQLLHDERQLVDTEARLAPGSPFFIRGPQYGKGQIVFVLVIQ